MQAARKRWLDAVVAEHQPGKNQDNWIGHVVHRSPFGTLAANEVLEGLSLAQWTKVWTALTPRVEQLPDLDTRVPEEQDMLLLRAVAHLLRICVESQEQAVPDAAHALLLRLAVLVLHGACAETMLALEVSQAAERWYLLKVPGREAVIPYLLPYLLAQVLRPDATAADVSRIYVLRDALSLFDFADESSLDLLRLLLHMFLTPVVLRHKDGPRFLAGLFHLHLPLVSDIHQTIKNQLPIARKSICEVYGDVYVRAWKAAAGAFVAEIETTCLQDLMHLAVHCAVPTTGTTVRRVLAYVHEERRKHRAIDEMLLRLYEPILWRSLKASNALVRRNAVAVFVDVFPLQDPDAPASQTEPLLLRQLQLLSDLLLDEHVPVRCAAVHGACRVLAQFWEVMQAETTRVMLGRLVNDLANDASSTAVRAAVLEGLTFLVKETHRCHAAMKVLLSRLAPSIHDAAERVRVAMLDLLLALKPIRGMRWWDMIDPEDVLKRVAIDGRAVAIRATKLLAGSYFPHAKGADTVLARIMTLCEQNPAASAVMLRHATSVMPADMCTRVAAMMYRTVYGAVVRVGRRPSAAEVGAGKRQRKAQRATKTVPLVDADEEEGDVDPLVGRGRRRRTASLVKNADDSKRRRAARDEEEEEETAEVLDQEDDDEDEGIKTLRAQPDLLKAMLFGCGILLQSLSPALAADDPDDSEGAATGKKKARKPNKRTQKQVHQPGSDGISPCQYLVSVFQAAPASRLLAQSSDPVVQACVLGIVANAPSIIGTKDLSLVLSATLDQLVALPGTASEAQFAPLIECVSACGMMDQLMDKVAQWMVALVSSSPSRGRGGRAGISGGKRQRGAAATSPASRQQIERADLALRCISYMVAHEQTRAVFFTQAVNANWLLGVLAEFLPSISQRVAGHALPTALPDDLLHSVLDLHARASLHHQVWCDEHDGGASAHLQSLLQWASATLLDVNEDTPARGSRGGGFALRVLRTTLAVVSDALAVGVVTEQTTRLAFALAQRCNAFDAMVRGVMQCVLQALPVPETDATLSQAMRLLDLDAVACDDTSLGKNKHVAMLASLLRAAATTMPDAAPVVRAFVRLALPTAGVSAADADDGWDTAVDAARLPRSYDELPPLACLVLAAVRQADRVAVFHLVAEELLDLACTSVHAVAMLSVLEVQARGPARTAIHRMVQDAASRRAAVSDASADPHVAALHALGLRCC